MILQRSWGASLLLGLSSLLTTLVGIRGSSAELNVFRTNTVDRFITNVVEVTIPENRFVTVYRTNYVPVTHTNLVTRHITNALKLTVYATNHVTAYRTNVNFVNLTNLETVFRITTNWITQPVTNFVAVNAYKTNFFEAFHTNYQVLSLTNWRTVLVMRTNLTTQFVTNTVNFDTPGETPKLNPVIGSAVEPEPPRGAMVLSQDLRLEATRTSTTSRNGQVEVALKLVTKTGQSVQIQQWRVESEDGSVLSFATDQEFKRALTPGRYKVEARARKDKTSVLITRSLLEVSPQEVSLQPTPVAMR